MAYKMSWEDFRYEYIEQHSEFGTGFLCGDRTKTIKAMRHLWQRIPPRDLDRLPFHVAIIAPCSLGCVYPWYNMPTDVRGQVMPGVLIYLSPEMEKKSQNEVDFIVAHEFAHAILHDPRKPVSKEKAIPEFGRIREREADALIAKWGFMLRRKQILERRHDKKNRRKIPKS